LIEAASKGGGGGDVIGALTPGCYNGYAQIAARVTYGTKTGYLFKPQVSLYYNSAYFDSYTPSWLNKFVN